MGDDLANTLTTLKPAGSDPVSNSSRSSSAPDRIHASSSQSQSHVDPSTITTLEDAIEYIDTVVAGDVNAVYRLRRMRKHQEDHECQWYAGRVAIIEKHKKRREGRLKLQSMLSLVGGDTSETPSEQQAIEDECRELKEYDRKVHDACTSLVKSMSLELADLHIPLFCNGIPRETAEADLKLSGYRRQVIERLEEIASI
ncbi:uncharacterized protein V1513DRAFT_426057 [Lipomyces chichibuensis]|uniref:uncharacterized protein n=1 Tax=Lipomyces chichibuensis TaxID=1546026 RepID=UPI0033432F3D